MLTQIISCIREFLCFLKKLSCRKSSFLKWLAPHDPHRTNFIISGKGYLFISVICFYKTFWRNVFIFKYYLLFSLFHSVQFSRSAMSNSFETPWIAARQASLSITNSQSSLRLISIELVMPSNHLILCRPFLLPPSTFPASGSFQMSQLFPSGGQNIGVSALVSVLPMNTQDWSPLEWTGWISLQSKGLSRVFSDTTVGRQCYFMKSGWRGELRLKSVKWLLRPQSWEVMELGLGLRAVVFQSQGSSHSHP